MQRTERSGEKKRQKNWKATSTQYTYRSAKIYILLKVERWKRVFVDKNIKKVTIATTHSAMFKNRELLSSVCFVLFFFLVFFTFRQHLKHTHLAKYTYIYAIFNIRLTLNATFEPNLVDDSARGTTFQSGTYKITINRLPDLSLDSYSFEKKYEVKNKTLCDCIVVSNRAWSPSPIQTAHSILVWQNEKKSIPVCRNVVPLFSSFFFLSRSVCRGLAASMCFQSALRYDGSEGVALAGVTLWPVIWEK